MESLVRTLNTNYLHNRKQYIQVNNKEATNLLSVKCGVP